MAELPPKSNPNQRTNLTNELAKERNRAAAERTLMAWIRTCLSLISFGFAIDKILQALQQAKLGSVTKFDLGVHLVGLCFIGLGVFAMFWATIEHKSILRQIQRDDYVYAPPRSLAMTTAIFLQFIGLFAFIVVISGWF